MSEHKEWKKAVFIAVMIGGIVGLFYLSFPYMQYRHAIYRMLFYLPLVLGSFWFGLKGAIYVCTVVLILYLPYAIGQSQGSALEMLHQILEGILYVLIAVILGLLVEKERKRHRDLLRAEKLAAVGRAVSEVAHDMKTPLMAIGGFAKQVSKKLAQDDPNQEKLAIVIQETARLESMVNEMLDFGRPLEIQPTNTCLNELVLNTIEVAKPMAREAGVVLKAELDPSLPNLLMDGSRVEEALLNLIANAVQASPAGECVLVTTTQDRGGVVVKVADRGDGIGEEQRENVFHPFFSTKKGGTGLGLGIVKKIVEAHGGEVFFSPNGKKGVTFTVWYPFREARMY